VEVLGPVTENGLGDFFIADLDDELSGFASNPVVIPPPANVSPAASAVFEGGQAQPPVVSPIAAPKPEAPPVPAAYAAPAAPAAVSAPAEAPAPATSAPAPASLAATVPAAEPGAPAPAVPPVEAPPESGQLASSAAEPVSAGPTREQQLVATLDKFMRMSDDVEAAALVSLDGFTMASALPEGMHEDRVGAMSAAILGLGERAAVELGRGKLSQVFIEGDTGYVLLMAAGDRAVLTALANLDAKLGLLLYDMRDVADGIAGILG